ncbi:hypothetical protein H1D32_05900 [Anaerobacillus sp. CMMVII]|uniref:hypothetical protein n=1 Tax=Anaerobacillus sp. CMMVII TaxID=2755588 RepID=UPI0021B81C0E|nr:hypothetical protein [Anaerobacillus sp. CMMVII]MCT8137317.1 hypothetical protein [Anaerobacillus sp. CMMVII]
MNKELNQLRDQFDNYLSTKPVFNEEDKKRIRKKIAQNRTHSRITRNFIPHFLTAALVMVGIFFIGNFVINELSFTQNQNFNMPGNESTPVLFTANDHRADGLESRTMNDSNWLSLELLKTYQQFADTKDEEILRGLSPIEIFKFYFYAQELQDYETQYAFFIQDEMYIKIFPTVSDFVSAIESESREEHLQLIEEIKSTENLEEIFYNETSAGILISEEKAISFGLTKSENGIWRVNWLPFQ